MRIAMILDTDFPPDARVENEARSLFKDGHEIHLFSLCYHPFEIEVEDLGFLTVHRFRANRLIYKLSALAYDLPFYRWLVSRKIHFFLKQVNPDAIHIHDMVIAKSVLNVSLKMKVLKVLDLHENRPEIMEFYPHTKVLPGSLLINLDRWREAQFDLVKKVDHVVLVTQEAKDYYATETEQQLPKFTVVPNTLHPETFRIKNEELATKYEKSFTILYVGNTGIRRGTLFALEALSQMRLQIPNVKLVLVGSSSEDYILKRYTEENGLCELVDFCGWVEPGLLPSYINATDVCISPLQRNLHHDTTFANKIFQYMVIEKPILVSDCPPQKRIAEEYKCGLVHRADSVEDFLEKIVFLFQNEVDRKLMGENGKKAVMERLNFNVTSQSLRDFYLANDPMM